MNTKLQKLFENEIITYLIFGVVTTLVYIISRLIIFQFYQDATSSAGLANIIAIIFAFITNDTIVFKQVRKGWVPRFVKFILARLVTMVLDIFLAFIFVDTFSHIIGQFVNDSPKLINSIETIGGQVLIIVFNYIFSKQFVFRDNK